MPPHQHWLVGMHDTSYDTAITGSLTRHITKPTPLPAVVKWPRSWTRRSNRHFNGTLVEAPSPLEENLTPGYSILPLKRASGMAVIPPF